MIILDSDICLSLLRGNTHISESVFLTDDEICITAVTAQELFIAANLSSNISGNQILVEKFLLTVRIIHPDLAVMKHAASVIQVISKKGISPNLTDILIYSTSKVYGAKLITSSSKRYCFT